MPGRWARERFAPDLSYGRHFGPSLCTTRQAAVIILLYHGVDGWQFPLTLRPPSMKHHGGQISLPGGSAMVGEDPETNALRELQEELGVDGPGMTLLGRLSSIYLFASDFLVTPVVARLDADFVPAPDPREVSRVFALPMADLIAPAHRARVAIRGGQAFSMGDAVEASPDAEAADPWVSERPSYAPAVCWKNHIIWGATAIILGELIEIVETIREARG